MQFRVIGQYPRCSHSAELQRSGVTEVVGNRYSFIRVRDETPPLGRHWERRLDVTGLPIRIRGSGDYNAQIKMTSAQYEDWFAQLLFRANESSTLAIGNDQRGREDCEVKCSFRPDASGAPIGKRVSRNVYQVEKHIARYG
jgi:hypothetical protein